MRRQASQELAAVQRRVEMWRAGGGGRGARIPEDLWRAAAEVARVAGVWATSRALHFNYERLRARANQSESTAQGERPSGPARFVALQLEPVGREGKTVIELVGQGGDQVRIDVTGASAVDVVALAQAFWGRQS